MIEVESDGCRGDDQLELIMRLFVTELCLQKNYTYDFRGLDSLNKAKDKAEL